MTAQKHTPDESREYPERIWAGHLGGGRRIWKPELMHESEKAFACQYVRADVADEMLAAGSSLMRALEQYGFPVSEAATEGLMKRGSLEAQKVHAAAIIFLAAIAKATGQ